ncbi:hypothetical protein SSP24_12990 [Streptomyces spinoverrucosus]|uniref:Uncharacterized protein n=1 Tax=Streptomyces spinoverrucosus TaxID=284043 RepID=A0A4Y3V9W8_9ACTN|nr:hypothetical protein [Streptomyces spinoverrucosus]GEC03644.1 hypothetical protein SSP24_12990 [Streptomyces spinoverrucosus]GHB51103.1 hypothetical protein GCM10010397_21680 [Streptomyces spinoverrucosus]
MGDWFLLLLLIMVGAITAFGLCGYAFSSLSAQGIRRADRATRFRFGAALAGAATAALYSWGALHVFGAHMEVEDGGTSSSPIRPCLAAGGPEKAAVTLRASVHVVPIRLMCHTKTGESYAAGVPGYVNPAVAFLALSSALLAVGAGYVSELKAREQGRKG